MTPTPSKRAVVLATAFSLAVWVLVIVGLCRAFVRDIIP